MAMDQLPVPWTISAETMKMRTPPPQAVVRRQHNRRDTIFTNHHRRRRQHDVVPSFPASSSTRCCIIIPPICTSTSLANNFGLCHSKTASLLVVQFHGGQSSSTSIQRNISCQHSRRRRFHNTTNITENNHSPVQHHY